MPVSHRMSWLLCIRVRGISLLSFAGVVSLHGQWKTRSTHPIHPTLGPLEKELAHSQPVAPWNSCVLARFPGTILYLVTTNSIVVHAGHFNHFSASHRCYSETLSFWHPCLIPCLSGSPCPTRSSSIPVAFSKSWNAIRQSLDLRAALMATFRWKVLMGTWSNAMQERHGLSSL